MDASLVVSGSGSGSHQLRAVGDRAPLVWKFGGTSVADHARLRAAAERMVAAQRAGHQVVATLSAMGKSTDELSAMAYAMSARPPLRELDVLLSVGESASCALASIAVAELGSRAVSLNGPQAGIQTDVNHGNARVTAVEPRRIREALADGSIVLVTGSQTSPACSPPTSASCRTHAGSTSSATRRCWRWPKPGPQ